MKPARVFDDTLVTRAGRIPTQCNGFRNVGLITGRIADAGDASEPQRWHGI
jgi:hypothetical protein